MAAMVGVALQGICLGAVEGRLTWRLGGLRDLQTPAGRFSLPIEDVVPLP